MNKKNKILTIGVTAAIATIAILIWIFKAADTPEKYFSDIKNGTYEIEGQSVRLDDGYAEIVDIPGSNHKSVIKYFGNEASGDLNGDNNPDKAFLFTKDNGASGTFFYVVAALKANKGYVGTNAILIGDRIAPQNTEIRDGILIVNYADREPGQPMTSSPTAGISKYLRVIGEKLEAVEIKNR